MALTYGFYNSLGGDRKYNSEQMSTLFDGIIRDGIFADLGTSMVVMASSGMAITIGTGRAWFRHTWTNNDTLYPMTIEPSEIVLNRIDTVVLEVNHNEEVRANSFKVIKGTPNLSPSKPALTNDENIGQLPLCHITVRTGVTEIKQQDIENVVGTVECPFITGILETVTIEGITSILNERWEEWFSTIQNHLSGDIAGNLLSMIQKSTYVSSTQPIEPMNHTVWYKIESEEVIEDDPDMDQIIFEPI